MDGTIGGHCYLVPADVALASVVGSFDTSFAIVYQELPGESPGTSDNWPIAVMYGAFRDIT